MRALRLSLAVLLALGSVCGAETVRGELVGLTLAPDDPVSTFSIRAGELVAVDIAEENRLLQSVILELSFPGALERYRDSLGLYVFSGVSPDPSFDTLSYHGDEVFFGILGTTSPVTVAVPLHHAPSDPKAALYTIPPVKPDGFPLLVVVLPVSKGVPMAATQVYMDLTVRSVISAQGILLLNIQSPSEGDPFVLFVDEEPVPYRRDGYLLSPGFHSIEVRSEVYQDRSFTVAVEHGRSTSINVELARERATVSFGLPETAEVFLNGERVSSTSPAALPIEEGEHSVTMRLGSYSLTQGFTARAGQAYRISLQLELVIEER